MHLRACLVAVLIWVLGGQGRVLAQDVLIPVPPDLPNLVAAVAGFVPEFEGADDYQLGALPAAQYSLGKNRYVRLIGTELSANILPHRFLRLGPSVNYRFGRDDVEDAVVGRMKKIEGAIELGVFGGVDVVNETNPRYRFNASLQYLQDVSDEHDGSILTLSARYWRPVGKPFDVSIGGALTYASGNYMSTFFGVTSADSAASGLRTFDSEAGIKDFSLTPMLVMHLSRTWHIGVGLRYKRLLSDAADSPVVDERGSSSQFVGGVGVIYGW